MNKVAIDTNVLLYFLDLSLPERRKVAAEIILQHPVFNSQSLSELINVLTKRWKYPKLKVMKVVNNFMDVCHYVPLSDIMVAHAFYLVKK